LKRPPFDALLLTCEHASNSAWRWPQAFAAEPQVLDTHRAWDPGAAVLARELAVRAGAPLFEGEFTRLLIDLNRMANAPAAFSEFTPPDARPELTAWHERWRGRVLESARELMSRGTLLHVSCHSFTPVLDGVTRETEFGILFDPAVRLEADFADWFGHALVTRCPDHRTRMNYPYDGTSDGITTWLRTQLEPGRYAGIEIELNQSFAAGAPELWLPERVAIIDAIRAATGR